MTTHRPITLRELPATSTNDPAAIARNARSRYSAEWETPEGIGDEPDPLWSIVGFGPDEQGARADLAAHTAHNRHGEPDVQIRDALGELANDLELMNAAIERAEQYAQGAFNTAQTTFDADERLKLTHAGSKWAETMGTLLRIATAVHDERAQTMTKPEPTNPVPAEPATELPPEVAQVSRTLEALFGIMPPEARQSHTFSVGLKTSDGRPVVAIVATRNAKVLAGFARLGVLDPTWDAPPADSSEHAAEEIVEDVNFTSPYGQAFDGSPADVGAAVAEALIEHDGETWSLPSVIREHAAEHLARVLDATQWSPSARAAAYHLYRLTTAASTVSP